MFVFPVVPSCQLILEEHIKTLYNTAKKLSRVIPWDFASQHHSPAVDFCELGFTQAVAIIEWLSVFRPQFP